MNNVATTTRRNWYAKKQSVWHSGLHKLKAYKVNGETFQTISSFLSSLRSKEVLNRKSSPEFYINAGVPQGCILVLTFSLFFNNDLPHEVPSDVSTDDITLNSSCEKNFWYF